MTGRGGAPCALYNSDGKPCSGVRGGHKASTDFPLSWETTLLLPFLTIQRSKKMNKTKNQKLAMAGLLCAVAVVGSMFSFPVFGSRCAPVQHMVNILCAVMLGPWYGVGVAFCASLIRNLLGLGSLLAFPGSMFGALLCGIAFWKIKSVLAALLSEVFGTAVLGGLCAYPIAILFMGQNAGELAFYAYIMPFLISTAGGAALSGILLYSLKGTGILKKVSYDYNN